MCVHTYMPVMRLQLICVRSNIRCACDVVTKVSYVHAFVGF